MFPSNRFGQSEVVFTDKITVRNDVVVSLFVFGRQRDRAATIGVIQSVEMVFGVVFELGNTFVIRSKQDHINLIAVGIVLVSVNVAVLVADAFITELYIGNAELAVKVSIRSRQHIVNGIVIDALAEHVKHLRFELELHDLFGKLIVFSAVFQRHDIVMDHLNDIGDNIVVRTLIDQRLHKQM